MKGHTYKLLALAGAVFFVMGCLAGCREKKEADPDEELSGTIQLAGSTSMKKLADFLAESFMDKYPDVTVAVEFTGSGAGIEAALGGSADRNISSWKWYIFQRGRN